jgi:class 3 adenylate cyclase
MSQTEWSDLGVSGLPTGTVTLLLADVEGFTRLWETQPDEMSAAIARLDDTLRDLVEAHHGVRPVEQGEGDSFVLASRGPATRLRAPWRCSERRWRRFGCGSGSTPARSSCATRATTSARRSTALRGYAIWRMVARPCCRARQSRVDIASTARPGSGAPQRITQQQPRAALGSYEFH